MTKREAHIEALSQIWGFASMLHEGIEKNELSDNLGEDVEQGKFSEEDAIKVQKAILIEADLIFAKRNRLIKNGGDKLIKKFEERRRLILEWKASLQKINRA